MQLTLLAPPSETILAELYGWGELPISWINERGADFDTMRKLSATGPLCVQSQVKCMPDDCSYSHIYMFPAEPTTEELAVCNQQRKHMEMECLNRFRLHYIHAGVECFAFM
jgi:hypothetical protein